MSNNRSFTHSFFNKLIVPPSLRSQVKTLHQKSAVCRDHPRLPRSTCQPQVLQLPHPSPPCLLSPPLMRRKSPSLITLTARERLLLTPPRTRVEMPPSPRRRSTPIPTRSTARQSRRSAHSCWSRCLSGGCCCSVTTTTLVPPTTSAPPLDRGTELD